MDRHKDVRRTSMAAANGLSRRRQRTTSSSLRDSPEEDAGLELQETSGRLRDRGTTTSSKKDRERDRISSRNNNKRRRPERLIHGNSNREDAGEESSEDSLDDEDEEDDEEMGGPGPAIRMRPPSNNNNPSSSSSILSNHHQNQNQNHNHHPNNQNQIHHRKSFPPSNNNHNKALRPATTPWKVSDEMGFSVPKKARSASTKRSHECWVSGGGGNGGSGELLQNHRQTSTSPARPTGVAVVTPGSSFAPGSPSSSTASVRKKMKPIGNNKHRPPKVVSTNNNNNNKPPPSSIQDEIEIEVAEVLYGLMRQSQGPSRQEISQQRLDSKDGSNDAKSSRVSSPISASPSQISKLAQNSSSSTPPMSTVAPKRKRPRPQQKFDEEISAKFANKNGSIESEQISKIETSSPKQVKISGSVEFEFGQAVEPKSELANLVNEESEVRDGPIVTSPKKESTAAKVDFDSENATATTTIITTKASIVVEKEENFKFDLMATPLKSSPDRDSEMGFVSDSKPTMPASDNSTEMKMEVRENVEKMTKKDLEESVQVEKKKKKTEVMVEECESQKSIDLQLDLEKQNNDSGGPNNVRQQQQQEPLHQQQQQQSKVTIRNEPKSEKSAQSNSSLPLPMTIAGWPGGLPPMGNGVGQVRPLQGMATLDGNPASSNSVQPPHFPLSQPRPKRCATHYYVARTIYYHQQVAKMNPFWPAVAGSASIYGNKPYNLNVLPPTETAIIGNPLLGSFPGRNLNPNQEKVQVEGAKEKSAVTNFIDPAQRKQLVLQQPPQQAALHGPAFIFPLNQQPAAPLPANKSGVSKSSTFINAASSIASHSAAGAPGNPSTAAAGATSMSFNYANMPGNEAQYVAILQNNGYTFPVSAHVGAAPAFRGTPSQAMPFFNGSFYSSQMIHPSQIQQQIQQQQQQQQQLQQTPSQQQPLQQGHQNTSTSSGSSSSQKHQQNQQPNQQQQRVQGGGGNVVSGNSNSFPSSKNRAQKQQNQSFSVSHQIRQHEVNVEDSPSTEDSRVSQIQKNGYGHNFAMPTPPKNFASMSSAALGGCGSGNPGERYQQQQQPLVPNSKGGAELIPAQAFAMPFASFSGGQAVSGLDFSSMAQNHVIFQSHPEAARHGYQFTAQAAAAQAAQQKKTHQSSEDGKTTSDSNNADDERKAVAGKGQPGMAQTIVFSRPDSNDPAISTILGSSVVESSARTLNLISSSGNGNRAPRSNTSTTAAPPTTSTTVNTSNSQQQQQQQQMQQFIQIQKQQQHMQLVQQQQLQQQIAAATAARGKPSTTSSNSAYSDRISSSSSMAVKFQNAQNVFPQGLIQGGSSAQSPQWKNTRPNASPGSSPSVPSTTSVKNLPQQQGRNQQGHTQISFGVNSKQGMAQHGQQIPSGNQSPSHPVVVGSPPTSNTKSAGGSPRASSTGSKVGSAPSSSSQQQSKNSSSGPSRKSSPVSGRNVPSNLGNSHATPAPCSNTKAQSQQHLTQQQQQQLQQQQQQQNHALQQAHLLFSNAYMQGHSPHPTNTTGNSTGAPNSIYYQQQRRQPSEQLQQQPLSSSTASSGMLSLSPSLTLAGTAASDPTKAAAAAAAANMKGGFPPPGLLQAAQFASQSGGHQFMSTAFPYIPSVPAVVKPAEQKQPAA